jgi:hypothetical protein
MTISGVLDGLLPQVPKRSHRFGTRAPPLIAQAHFGSKFSHGLEA